MRLAVAAAQVPLPWARTEWGSFTLPRAPIFALSTGRVPKSLVSDFDAHNRRQSCADLVTLPVLSIAPVAARPDSDCFHVSSRTVHPTGSVPLFRWRRQGRGPARHRAPSPPAREHSARRTAPRSPSLRRAKTGPAPSRPWRRRRRRRSNGGVFRGERLSSPWAGCRPPCPCRGSPSRGWGWPRAPS